MKIKPEVLLINDQEIFFKKILITGSDESLMNHVVSFLVNQFKKKNYFIDTSEDISSGLVGDLFSDKKVLFLIRNVPVDKKVLEKLDLTNQKILISSPNNKKINSIKAEFMKSKDSLLVECYTLNRLGKEMVVKNFVRINGLDLSNDVYWYVIDRFNNDYVMLTNQLQSLSLFNEKITSVKSVERAVFIENKIELNKIFFHIFKDNKTLINVFNKNIYSQTDFFIFLNSLKLYLQIINNSQNKVDALGKFPRYLFNERDIFIKIYNYLNKDKISKIYESIFRVEKLTRVNSGLYFIIGQRFLIGVKKIITS